MNCISAWPEILRGEVHGSEADLFSFGASRDLDTAQRGEPRRAAILGHVLHAPEDALNLNSGKAAACHPRLDGPPNLHQLRQAMPARC